MKFNDRIRELRATRKFKTSQSIVANAIGVDRTTYSKYETGDSEPDFENVKKLADFYGVTVDYLLGREDDSQIISQDNTCEKLEYSDEEYQDFFAITKNFRSRRRFTIGEVANFLDISKTEYKEIESGAKRPDKRIVARICELYDVTESFLFGKEFQMGKDLIDPAILKVELTEKDLREVSQKAELAKTAMLSVLEATFDNPKDPDTIKKINAAIDEAHILAKKATKAKYTPFKFRK